MVSVSTNYQFKMRVRDFPGHLIIALIFLLGITQSVTVTGHPHKVKQGSKSGLQEKRTEQLNERYSVDWQANFNESIIDFWITAETMGYVGFGLSFSGQMNGADLVIGGLKNGKPYFNDYHGVKHWPVLDSEQNWEALEINEFNGKTFLHLRRGFSTCDGNDLDITKGTVKLIWSLGADHNIQHHEIRGALAVNLLDPPPAARDLSRFSSFDLMQDIEVTSTKHTIYSCSVHKRTANGKSHLVAFKPKLETDDALRLTHHFNVYSCKVPAGESLFYDDDNYDFENAANRPAEDCATNVAATAVSSYCAVTLYAWSFGGRILVLPDEVGIPWGFEQTEYFFFQVHVDNQNRENLNFRTGVTFYYSDTIRPVEAGVLTVALGTDNGLLIPPRTADWTLAGHCSPKCTEETVPEKGINIFNVNLHAHVSATKMKFRHFRHDRELPWIAKDDNYDFNFQENRPIAKHAKILPGDQLTLECTYDSTWKNTTVLGGSSSFEEMCMVFAVYYPRSRFETCSSSTNEIQLLKQFQAPFYEDTFQNFLDKEFVWNETFKAKLNRYLRYGVKEGDCVPLTYDLSKIDDSRITTMKVGYPNLTHEYVEKSVSCNNLIMSNFLPNKIVVIAIVGATVCGILLLLFLLITLMHRICFSLCRSDTATFSQDVTYKQLIDEES